MKFGLQLKQPGVEPRDFPRLGALAEASGFESVWISEHVILPTALSDTYPYSDDGSAPMGPFAHQFDPWAVLGAVAAVTSSIRLATGIYLLPLRHPIATARSVATLDQLSDGRVTLGIGVGWLAEEFRALQQSFANRGGRTEECISIIRNLWEKQTFEFHGSFFDFEPVAFEPKPVQKSVPIEIGGTSRSALNRAGRTGDGWIELGSRGITELRDRIRHVNGVRQESDRLHLPFEITCAGGATLNETRHLEDIGVTRILAGLRQETSTFDDLSHWIVEYSHKVIQRQ